MSEIKVVAASRFQPDQAIFGNYLSPRSFWLPDLICESAWVEHGPFAFWLTEALRPRCFVELGTHFGFSYFAICQAVKLLGLETRCYAVDTWRGDEHAGFYSDEVFEKVKAYNNSNFSDFSRLIRSTFDAAIQHFSDGSIDLLHIDGRHFYDDVRHDFGSWRPKLSDRSVVIFHDINVREGNFGVWRLWEELKEAYPNFEFFHGHGLGILGTGKAIPDSIASLFTASNVSKVSVSIRSAYARLGSSIEDRRSLTWAITEHQQLQAELVQQRVAGEQRQAELVQQRAAGEQRQAELIQQRAASGQLQSELVQQRAAGEQRQAELIQQRAAGEQLQARLTQQQEEWSRQAGGFEISLAQHKHEKGQLENRLRDARERADTLERAVQMLTQRMRDIETSTSWLLTAPMRAAFSGSQKFRTIVRRILKLVWWTLTLQLISKLKARWSSKNTPELAIAQLESQRLYSTSPGVSDNVTSDEATPLPPSTETERASSMAAQLPRWLKRPHVMFVSGEADTPGHKYRIKNIATALAPRFFDVAILRIEDFPQALNQISGTDIVWIWRARWTENVQMVIDAARATGAKIVFDVDDLMFRPELATPSIIDGIRSQGFSEVAVQQMYGLVQKTMNQADHCVAPTESLARELADFHKPITVIPNGFDHETFEVSRAARLAAIERRKNRDGLIRIGYATGSRTHQKDFAVAAPAIADILNEYPETRLVLFENTIDLTEFPELEAFSSRIEWRQFVPIDQLPNEYARFDINIAPLEAGNRFCEAKSELKFFEAALVGVPTIASPTGPFVDAIRQGETGFLANDRSDWYRYLSILIADSDHRRKIADTAYTDILWKYGHGCRAVIVARLVDTLLQRASAQADMYRLGIIDKLASPLPAIAVPEFDVLYESTRREISRITVVIPVFNYAHTVKEALDSLREQTLRKIDIVIVDDQSTDDSVEVVRGWLNEFGGLFNKASLLQNWRNSKLAATRNVGFAFSDTEYVFPLDADNTLLPDCLENCLAVLDETNAAMAYPKIELFGDKSGAVDQLEWNPGLLQCGNYIDAMALIRKDCWIAVGGYDRFDLGWEDYDFWCKLVEKGLFGVRAPAATARYRVHGRSMLQTVTDLPENRAVIISQMSARHPWLRLRVPTMPESQKSTPVDPIARSTSSGVNISDLLDILRCPVTGERLKRLDADTLESVVSGRHWPILNERPVFTADGVNTIQHPDTHLSNPLSTEAIRIINQASGRVLNLSGGGTSKRYPNVVEVEYSMFRNTDVIADAHQLPFDDEVFEAVICLNAFEHYRDPEAVMGQIHRVLKPGGRLYLHTAFLQPLHEAPHHYFNCTEFGLAQWLKHFTIETIQVSENFNPVYAFSWFASELEAGLLASVSPQASANFREAQVGEFVSFWRNTADRKSHLWNNFYALSPQYQRKLSAGWEAIAQK